MRCAGSMAALLSKLSSTKKSAAMRCAHAGAWLEPPVERLEALLVGRIGGAVIYISTSVVSVVWYSDHFQHHLHAKLTIPSLEWKVAGYESLDTEHSACLRAAAINSSAGLYGSTQRSSLLLLSLARRGAPSSQTSNAGERAVSQVLRALHYSSCWQTYPRCVGSQ